MTRLRPGRPGATDQVGRLTPPWTLQRLRFAIMGVIALALLVVAMRETGASPARLWSSLEAVRNLLDRMWPPLVFEWRRYLSSLILTFWMVIAATGLALLMSVPVAILSARNTTTGRIAFSVSRGIIVFTRAVPDIVWALIFVRAIGIGVMAGVLAMGVNSIGMLGKLYADAIEEAPKGPIEAMRAGGAGRGQVFVTGILPQVMPTWVSLALYRVDINVRTSVILGFVGAGGIGFELQRVLGQLAYRRGLTIIFMMFLLIAAVEQLSAFARKAIIAGDVGPQQNPFGLRARLRELRSSRARVDERPPARDLAGQLGPATASTAAAGTVVDVPAMVRGVERVRQPTTTVQRRMRAIGLSSLALFLYACWATGLTPARFFMSFIRLGRVARRMFPPDFVTNWTGVADKLLETFWIATAATVLGLLLSIPFAICAARNTAPNKAAYHVSRFAMLAERGVPELVLAVLFVVAVGLGPFAGVLALTVGAIGFTGKLLADGIENLPMTGVEGLTANGATWMQRIFTGILPQAMPLIVGIGIYTLDVYIRAATILGIVGAGGIGGILNSTVQTHAFDRTLAIVLCIFVMIYGFERLSSWIRHQLI